VASDKIKELEEELEGCYRAIDDLRRLNRTLREDLDDAYRRFNMILNGEGYGKK
jgi:hypothetical protein